MIKTSDDLNLYILGLCTITLLSNISLWVYLKKYIALVPLKEINIARNIKTILSLFVPTIAIQVYTVLDKTMIGYFSIDAYENGYFEQAQKIAKMALTVVTSLGTVMIPRIGYHFARNEIDSVNRYMYRGYRFVWLVGLAISFGLIGIADNFVPWFFGIEFLEVIPLLKISSLLIIAIGLSNITGLQYLIPTRRQRMLTFTVTVGAIVNFCLNLILIPKFFAFGAMVGSITAETLITCVQLYLVRKELSINRIVKSAKNYFVAASIMLIALRCENLFLTPSFLNTLILIVSGSGVYILVLFFL